MSDRRDDDVSIEADAPEADWIEQHQPVGDDVDDTADDDAVSIEADVPEADWIEQHEPVIDDPDDAAVDDEPPVAWPPPLPPDTSASAGARGCNLLGAFVHALLRSRRDAAGPRDRRNPRSSG